MRLSDLNQRRLDRVKRVLGKEFHCWHMEDERSWHAWHHSELVGKSCHNYWELFAWARLERERRDNGTVKD